jgi:hypothetical protein
MNEKQQLLVDMGVMLSRDEIMELVGADTWEDVEVNFGGIPQGWVLAECNRMWPGDDNDYLALSISEQLTRSFADDAADVVNALADELSHKRLYAAVVALVTTDPNPRNETSLEDWLIEGDTDGMTPEEIAAEWDEVNSHNPRK